MQVNCPLGLCRAWTQSTLQTASCSRPWTRGEGRLVGSRTRGDRLHVPRLPRLTELIAVNFEVSSLQDGYFGDIDRDRGDGEGKRVLGFSCGLGDRALR